MRLRRRAPQEQPGEDGAERRAGLSFDQQGRIVVYPIHAIAHATPVWVLPADATDETLGETLRSALAASDPRRADVQTIVSEHGAALRKHHISLSELDRSPGLSLVASEGSVRLVTWRPVQRGKELAGIERDLDASCAPAEFGRAAREVLVALEAFGGEVETHGGPASAGGVESGS
jgi:hypothetical protein